MLALLILAQNRSIEPPALTLWRGIGRATEGAQLGAIASSCWCADDYGMTEAVSRGILEAAAAGRITATSAMTSLPDWPRAARAWRAAAPAVDLGLHVTLTVGAPLGRMPRLAPGRGSCRRCRAFGRRARCAPPAAGRDRGRNRPPDRCVLRRRRRRARPCRRPPACPCPAGRPRGAVRRAGAPRLAGQVGCATVPIACPPHRARGASRSRQGAGGHVALAAGFAAAARRPASPLNDGFAGYSDFPPARYGAQVRRLSGRARPAPSRHVPSRPGRRRPAPARSRDGSARARTGVFLLSDEFSRLLARARARLARHEQVVKAALTAAGRHLRLFESRRRVGAPPSLAEPRMSARSRHAASAPQSQSADRTRRNRRHAGGDGDCGGLVIDGRHHLRRLVHLAGRAPRFRWIARREFRRHRRASARRCESQRRHRRTAPAAASSMTKIHRRRAASSGRRWQGFRHDAARSTVRPPLRARHVAQLSSRKARRSRHARSRSNPGRSSSSR